MDERAEQRIDRYGAEEDGGAEQGGVTLEPALQSPPSPPAGQEPPSSEETPLPPPAVPQDPCLAQEQLLAQRLLYLRGVFVDQESALLAWSSAEWPLAPYVTMPMFGRPTWPIGGPFLVNALSWDMRTQELTHDLATCRAGY